MNPADDSEAILIHCLGSLGDMLISIPILKAIRRRHPGARIVMLTNKVVSTKAPDNQEIFSGMGLVDNYVYHSIGMRNPIEVLKLLISVRRFHVTKAYYLTGYARRLSVPRRFLLLKLCGVRRIIGLPFSSELAQPLLKGDGFEHEASRIARCTGMEDEVSLDENECSLQITTSEKELIPALNPGPAISMSLGAKVDVKDWGDNNWKQLLEGLSESYPDMGLVMVGSADEYARSESVAASWRGRVYNFCGKLSVRESAAVIGETRLFVGHDSGPMHLAAAVSVRCVAIFSARNLPGEWFPIGNRHHVFYNKVDCFGCNKSVCREYSKKCILSIDPGEVAHRIRNMLAGD